ncbi:hypothetical protein SEA_KERBEROS_71 [Mycobacterium phage Kerberos]|nr:hypothetical protein M178_gp63 [Mycobacterium phage Chy5]YP_008060224.1 hypothetical protein M179_gp64 [Mycobacterium phage Chy4]AOQ27902.1 hypothetical protein SEA_POMAR16_70 [Mycobacterium phage Pomar16]APC43119.1 hypothetical protein SEA_KERBEROS_71 [Mycobacterium phage Kerberos]QBP28729.1 hypothetical protein SEA_DBQU4N_71 [Mycobacterium phage DBQu4n]UXE05485.1 hypothetical protein SEA_DUPLO_71 [Mycobacterium phage Duplo]AGK86026.1 hypothetical protein Chy4_0064 [Mycobacterium phage Ch
MSFNNVIPGWMLREMLEREKEEDAVHTEAEPVHPRERGGSAPDGVERP